MVENDVDWAWSRPLFMVGRFQIALEAQHFKLTGLTVHSLAFHWYSE